MVVESIILLVCERTGKPFGPYTSRGKVVKLGAVKVVSAGVRQCASRGKGDGSGKGLT